MWLRLFKKKRLGRGDTNEGANTALSGDGNCEKQCVKRTPGPHRRRSNPLVNKAQGPPRALRVEKRKEKGNKEDSPVQNFFF